MLQQSSSALKQYAGVHCCATKLHQSSTCHDVCSQLSSSLLKKLINFRFFVVPCSKKSTNQQHSCPNDNCHDFFGRKHLQHFFGRFGVQVCSCSTKLLFLCLTFIYEIQVSLSITISSKIH